MEDTMTTTIPQEEISPSTPTDLEAAFRLIKEEQGSEALANDATLPDAFSAVAPTLLREKRLLAAFTAVGGGELLSKQGQSAVDSVKAAMANDYWIATEAAAMICEQFLTSLGQTAEDSLFAQAERCYRGDGVPLDKKKAAELYIAAAEEGDVNAAYTIGYMLDKGDGVEKDRDAAMVWYEKAAAGGHESAANRLSVLKQAQSQPQKPQKKKGLFGRG